MRVMTVFGTRPEVIKLAPVIHALEADGAVQHMSVNTGQHRELLTPFLQLFSIAPAHDLELMRPGHSLNHVAAHVMLGIEPLLRSFEPDVVVVHGDTTTTLGAALAAFHGRADVAHVEAGLRTHDLSQPFPEEMNRQVVDVFSKYLFAPTERAARSLREEGRRGEIYVTGNTVIDALYWVRDRIDADADLRAQLAQRFSFLAPDRRLLLVTGHRRESFDGGLADMCQALARLADRSDVQIVYPVHPNPRVTDAVRAALSDCPNVALTAPLPYPEFVYLMDRAHLVITDSGGVQEEATALGKPVLVTRRCTDRPETVDAGTADLVGTETDRIESAAVELLENDETYAQMAQVTASFGDGRAAERIRDVLLRNAP